MKYYTKEQIEQLEDPGILQSFMTSTVSDYKRGTSRKQDELVATIYDQTTGKKENRNMNCAQCVFQLYRAAGTLYYESKKYWEEYDRKKKEEEEKKIKNNKGKKETKKDNGKTKK